jgi:hypothetical protein
LAASVVELLEDVRHVQRDAVAAAEAEAAEREGRLGHLDQQALARDDLGDHGAAAPAGLGLIPAVALEDEGRLVAVPGEDVPVDLVEARVGERAVEPAVERRVRVVEGAPPRRVVGGELQRDGRAARRIEARPSPAPFVERDPRAHRRLEPVRGPSRDRAVVAARIGGARGALRLPIRAAEQDVGVRLGRRDGRRKRLHGMVRLGLRGRARSIGLSSESYEIQG